MALQNYVKMPFFAKKCAIFQKNLAPSAPKFSPLIDFGLPSRSVTPPKSDPDINIGRLDFSWWIHEVGSIVWTFPGRYLGGGLCHLVEVSQVFAIVKNNLFQKMSIFRDFWDTSTKTIPNTIFTAFLLINFPKMS